MSKICEESLSPSELAKVPGLQNNICYEFLEKTGLWYDGTEDEITPYGYEVLGRLKCGKTLLISDCWEIQSNIFLNVYISMGKNYASISIEKIVYDDEGDKEDPVMDSYSYKRLKDESDDLFIARVIRACDREIN